MNPVIEKAFVEHKVMKMHNITNEQRFAAAEVAKAKGLKVVGAICAPGTKAAWLPQPLHPLVSLYRVEFRIISVRTPTMRSASFPVVVNGTCNPRDRYQEVR